MTRRSSLVMPPVRSRFMVIVVMAFIPILVLLVQFTRAPTDSRVVARKILGICIDVSASVVLGLKLKRACDAAMMVRRMIILRPDRLQTAVSEPFGNTPLGVSMP